MTQILNTYDKEVSFSDNVKKTKRVRSWFIVLNEKVWLDNPEIAYENMENYLLTQYEKNIAYACWNEEEGDNGNKHMHLYIELNNGTTFNAIQKKFRGGHIEERRGNPTESRTYVQKPEGVKFSGKEKSHTLKKPFIEIGDWDRYKDVTARGEAKVPVTEKIDALLLTCNSYAEMCVIDPVTANTYKTVLHERLALKRIEDFKRDHCIVDLADNGEEFVKPNRRVAYVYGNTRCGKTTGVKRKYGDKNVSVLANLRKDMKWDDYDFTDVAIFDEFYGQLPLQEMLNLLDNSGIDRLPARYANRPFVASKIVLTSNREFSTLYANVQDGEDAKENERKYQAFVARFNWGIWEMYQSLNGKRYICLRTDVKKIEPRLLCHYNFTEPPVSLQNVDWVEPEDMDKIKYADLIKDIPF